MTNKGNSVANDATSLIEVEDIQRHKSSDGYWFSEHESIWTLSKSVNVNVGKVLNLLDMTSQSGFVSTLVHYARTFSPDHVANMNSRLFGLLRDTGVSDINPTMLINYRASLTSETEHFLGALRGFIYKWHDLGYPGISDDVIDLLGEWTLKGNVKGDAVQRLDPTEGPLTDNELLAFNEGVVGAFEKDRISITELSIALLTSNTGRRPKQIAHTKIGDLDGTRKNKKGEPMYLINIPRAKQRADGFRGSFKTFAMTQELWVVLNAQRKNCIELIEGRLGFELQGPDRLALPLFPDLSAFEENMSVTQLREVFDTDRLHMKSADITKTLQRVVLKSGCHSERTGEILEIFATRFRYTTGTRAAREGFGPMVIAELLDHTDTQNADVYIKNIPEHAAALDKAIGHLLAPYAQAFQGVLVDREEDARRGNDPTSRIRHKGEGTGTCGTYGFCGANVPIPCYTCMHFQPWLDGPHEMIYTFLHSERERILGIATDGAVAAVNDRTILAVAQVIQQCQRRRDELGQKAGK